MGTTGASVAVAADDTTYQTCGRVFSDPHAYWPSPAQSPGRSPLAKGNAACASADFVSYEGMAAIGFTRDGQTDTYGDPLAQNVNQPGAAEGPQHRHQTYEPVPIGYAIQDEDGADFNSSPVWAVDQIAWEQLGGRTVGITTADQTTLGELKLGKGQVRIVGALLPMPTEQYYHPFGLANHALTYTGYQVLQNAPQWQRTS